MKDSYFINIDLKDKKLRNSAVDVIMNTSFIERVCIFENFRSSNRFFMNSLPFDLCIFDDDYRPGEKIERFCAKSLKKHPDAVFIHVSDRPLKANSLHLIGIETDAFRNYFADLLGFCFLMHMVRESLINVKDALKDIE